ncbi:iron-siderophore ABC transporter substrate-binding protein [Brevibacillus fluminis]|uniref:Iron-siderophore ABC transporter substrate-binding protein n=1 Tax=Brevibacillus fluminis TaxID=511487 RepID=A0A3M8DHW8_9BACL|nr:iron-siderophore ABC transporter substrate-binding protein [Brevibacillus fluminis]RNB87634.1 iron-siderophore ABC transporter substrate-binding protein [Brevibacillus fluminis]
MLSFSKKKSTVLALMTAVMVMLAGCGTGNQAAAPDKNASQTTEQTQGSAAPSSEESYTIKHAMGETTIKGTPKRVVVLATQGVETVLALGVKPVGAVSSFTGNDFYPHVKGELEGVKVVGTESQPNLEAIAALKPDLILGLKFRQEKIYSQLSAIAPTVFAEQPRGDWKENFTLFAEAMNKKAEGEKVIADWDKRVADFKEKAGDKLKTKVSLVRFMPGKTRIYYKDTFAGVILEQLGFARPDAQNKPDFADDVTKERIPDMDGDIMFYYVYETGDNKASELEKEWTNDPLWKNLNVVKNNKVFKVDDVTWNTSGGVKSANLMLDDLEKFFLTK